MDLIFKSIQLIKQCSKLKYENALFFTNTSSKHCQETFALILYYP